MSLGTHLIGALLALMFASVCYAGICDEGPPRKFCFDNHNLTGYHDCKKDPKTGKMVDDAHQCPPDTRCTCMGILCDTDTPCGKYSLPPSWPEDYNMHLNTVDKTCNAKGCQTTYNLYSHWRDTKNKRYRRDSTTPATGYNYFIVSPNNQSTYDKYDINPKTKSCKKSTILSFPAKFSDIPSYFKYNGTETVTGSVTDRWIWMVGGTNSEDAISTYVWNVRNKSGPQQYRLNEPMSKEKQESRQYKLYVRTFLPGPPDADIFELPSFCESELGRYPKLDFNEVEKDDFLDFLELK